MKHAVTLLVCMLTAFILKAQDEPGILTQNLSIKIQQTSTSIDGTSADGFSIYVESSSKEVAKGWKSYLKDQYSLRTKKSGGMMKAAEAEMFDIWSANTVTFYYTVKGQGSGSQISVYMNLGGAYLNSSDHNDAADNLKTKLRIFVKSHYTEQLNDILKDESKAQKKENKSLAKLEKQKNKEEKTILKAEKNVTKANRSIDKAKDRIRKAEQEIEKMKGEITENEELAETTKEKQKVTEGEIKQQMESVGSQNNRVKKVHDQLNIVRAL